MTVLSAGCDALLYDATAPYGPRLSRYLLMLQLFCAGPPIAALDLETSLAMHGMTIATVGVLSRRHALCAAGVALGVCAGWPRSVIAFLPYARCFSAAPGPPETRPLAVVLPAALIAAAAAVLWSAGAAAWVHDTQLNPLHPTWVAARQVANGDEEESPLFYFRIGLGHFNLALVAAAVYPVVAMLQSFHLAVSEAALSEPFLLACAPLYVSFVVLTLTPTKRAAWLAPVYPQICLTAAAVAVSLSSLLGGALHDNMPAGVLSRKQAHLAGRLFTSLAIGTTVLLSAQHIFEILTRPV